MPLYLGTYTGGQSRGIYRFSDRNSALAAPLENPSYLIFRRDGTKAYAVSETQTFCGQNGGAAASFDVLEDGTLQMTQLLATQGKDPCHLCLSQQEDALFVANYTEGTLCRFALDCAGRLTGKPEIVRHTGHGCDPVRQEGPHIHFTALCPSHPDRLWVTDLGLDSVFVYGTSSGALAAPLARFTLPAGYGPRHIAFHPVLPLAYVICELTSRIAVLAVGEDGLPSGLTEDVSTLPPDAAGPNLAAAIRISADGKHLYASNRGHDSVAAFLIDSQGKLRLHGIFPAGGHNPRDIALTPDECTILCANQDGGGITALAIGPDALGAPQCLGGPDSPVCLQFLPDT